MILKRPVFRNITVTIIVTALFVLILNACPGLAKDPKNKCSEARKIEGKWMRPYGGYILDIKEARKDGTLDAAYFNPNSIHVSEARYRMPESQILIFIELRDIGYPGSTYRLRYNAVNDRLEGVYFQAMDKETYHIEFIRYPGLNP